MLEPIVSQILEQSKPRKIPGLRPGGAATLLSRDWPAVYAASIETYWDPETFGLVDPQNHCRAGYILAACVHAERLVMLHLGHRRIQHVTIDLALAREIRYQWHRDRRPERPCAFIFKCLCNLVVERPERFFNASRHSAR